MMQEPGLCLETGFATLLYGLVQHAVEQLASQRKIIGCQIITDKLCDGNVMQLSAFVFHPPHDNALAVAHNHLH